MASTFNKRHRLLARWTLVSAAVFAVVCGWAYVTRDQGEDTVLPGQQVEGLISVLESAEAEATSAIRFRDVTADSGIDFHHFPAKRASLLPEDMGSGVAFGDYDNDGLTDLFLVNFASSLVDPLPSDAKASCRLYRNLGGMRFEDVTDQSGLGWIAYGMGASWGDYDNDGDLDLYVTAHGDNALFENAGDGTFRDVTDKSGIQDARFSAGCSWADFDRDGDLDLYVCNYVEFTFKESDRGVVKRQYDTEQPYTLNPSSYKPLGNSLFVNQGDGSFAESGSMAGIADPSGRSLSAAWVDFDNDGWLDLYVANDVSNNGVFLNRRDGTFEDVGPSSLAADYRGAMGIAAVDFDNDLDQDLLITHWIAQENALYRNMHFDAKVGASQGRGPWFMDAADECGLGQISLDMVGWATGFADFDNDGRRDLWLINGSTLEDVSDHSQLVAQRPFLFGNRGNDHFEDVASSSCPTMGESFVGRGGAQADLDGDGLIDLLFVVRGAEPVLLHNVTPNDGHWLRIRLRQRGSNSSCIGARALLSAGGVVRMAAVGVSPSYLSQSEMILHFGLGQVDSIDSLLIVWPDGVEEEIQPPTVDQLINLEHDGRYPLQLVDQDNRQSGGHQLSGQGGAQAIPVRRIGVERTSNYFKAGY